jgi:pimeloyl-ACP methyl ester carboxylesterase
MAQFETRQIAVNGVRSPVLVGGAGTSGEAVVFVHGNPDTGSDWLPLMEPVAEFATAVAPDMPGFGGADKPEHWHLGPSARRRCTAHRAGLPPWTRNRPFIKNMS